MFVLHDRLHLVHLATESHEQVAADVRMTGDAGQNALQDKGGFARIIRATAGVLEGDHAIHVRKIPLQHIGSEPFSDVSRNGCGTVHAGNDRDVIARAGAIARTGEALKGAQLIVGIMVDLAGVGAIGVITIECTQFHVMHVHMVPHRDVTICKSNGLTVTFHRVTVCNRLNTDLVSRRNRLIGPQWRRRTGQLCSLRNRPLGDRHGIFRVHHQQDITEWQGSFLSRGRHAVLLTRLMAEHETKCAGDESLDYMNDVLLDLTRVQQTGGFEIRKCRIRYSRCSRSPDRAAFTTEGFGWLGDLRSCWWRGQESGHSD